MADSKLDRIVKGAPPPNVSPDQLAAEVKSITSSSSPSAPSHPAPTAPALTNPPPAHDPRDTLPDSDAQKYLNLLILESSLRLQYLSLRTRLRLHLLLLSALALWTLAFTYLLFFRPREDGSGVGGSVYWVLETAEKLGLSGGLVTLALFWGTGMWERGVRWPRRFVGSANRGLRGFNMKLVLVRARVLPPDILSCLGLGGGGAAAVDFQPVPRDIEGGGGSGSSSGSWNHHVARHGLVEEDIAPGGDVLKLLILPKPFSPDFREGWENYRAEYWEKENARRAEVRKMVRARVREVARREGGWLWWTGWRGWDNVRLLRGKTRRQLEMDKLALREQQQQRLAADPGKEKQQQQQRRRESMLLQHPESHSHSRSRSSSLAPDADARHARRPAEERARRGSSSARRPRKAGTATGGSRLSATETLLEGSNNTVSKRSSTLGGGEVAATDESSSTTTPEIKQEPAEA